MRMRIDFLAAPTVPLKLTFAGSFDPAGIVFDVAPPAATGLRNRLPLCERIEKNRDQLFVLQVCRVALGMIGVIVAQVYLLDQRFFIIRQPYVI